jgi:hypothetical protein
MMMMMQNLHSSEVVDEMEKARQELQKWMQERVRNVEDIKKKHQNATAKYTGIPCSSHSDTKSLLTSSLFRRGCFPSATDEIC